MNHGKLGSLSVAVALATGCATSLVTPGFGPSYEVSVLAGSGGGDSDGLGRAAKFGSINDLALDEDGFLFVSDQVNRRIRRVSPNGMVTTVAGSGALGSADGPALKASFKSPGALAVDRDGSLLVIDHELKSIRRIRADVVETLNVGAGELSAIHVSMDGKILVTSSSKVFRLRDGIEPELVLDAESLGLPIIEPAETSPPIAKNIALQHISSLRTTAEGALVIAQPYQRRIVEISPTGNAVQLAYGGAHGLGESVDGPLGTAKLRYPVSFALLANGSLAIADDNRVRVASPAMKQISTAISSNPTILPLISRPEDSEIIVWSIASGPGGIIFFADSRSRTIFKMTPR